MPVLQLVLGIFLFFLILGLLVVIHELGHFVTARLAGIRVHEFGIGFPPRAKVLRSEGETLYTLNYLPIGGFVRLEGEDGDSDDPRSFTRAALPIKLIVLVAGVAMNLLLSVVIMSGIAMAGDQTIGVQIGEVQRGSPASQVGIVAGDTLVSLNGVYYSAFEINGPDILDDLRTHAGETVTLGIVRAGGASETIEVQLRGPSATDQGLPPLGIASLQYVPGEHRISYGPIDAVGIGVARTSQAVGLIGTGLADLAESIASRPTTAPAAAGPVGIAVQISDVLWRAGPLAVLWLAGILSANLAVVNILPFPPLDGGRMVMILLKSVAGNRISLRFEQATYLVGFTFLMAFLLWITFFDITRIAGR